jgi:hypothetical protein
MSVAASVDLGVAVVLSTEHNAVQSLPEFTSLVDLDLTVLPNSTAFTYNNHLMPTTHDLMLLLALTPTSQLNSAENMCIDFLDVLNLELPLTNIALGFSPVFTVVSLQPSAPLNAVVTSTKVPTRPPLPAHPAAPLFTLTLVSAILIEPRPALKASARCKQQIQAVFPEHSDCLPALAEVKTSLPNSIDRSELGKLNEGLADVKEHDKFDQEMQDVAAILVALPTTGTEEVPSKTSAGSPSQSSTAHPYKATQPPVRLAPLSSQSTIATVAAPTSSTIENPVLVDSDNKMLKGTETMNKFKATRTRARSRKRRQTADGVVR